MNEIEIVEENSALGERAMETSVEVDPGICGFHCSIRVIRLERRLVNIEIVGSDCLQIQRLSKMLGRFSLRDLFMPLTKNPIFIAAEAAGCHTSCIVPSAALKAAEAAMEMALPKDIRIRFLSVPEKTSNE